MRIKTFNILAQNEAEDYTLKNCPVVIDGSNFFYNAYKDSGLPFAFGCDCDKYEDYIREMLSMFEKSNVTCYFLFKGGVSNIQSNMNKYSKTPRAKDYNPMQKDAFIQPIFAEDVCMQVLKEMGIKYTVCKMESKKQCMALAHDLNCPIISYDIEYCFSNIPYILSNTLSLNEINSEINCRLFRLNTFLDKYSLTKEKLVYFILLRDETLFPEGTFSNFFKHIQDGNLSHFQRNISLMNWLSMQPTKESILEAVFMYMNEVDKKIFLKKENDAKAFIDPEMEVGIPVKYLKNENIDTETQNDKFEHAIAIGLISRRYINLYTDNFIKYDTAIQDNDSINAFFSVLDIVKFVYFILTDTNNNEFTVYDNEADSNIIKIDRNHVIKSIWPKMMRPNIKRFKTVNYNILERIPDDAKVLFIALTYCAVKHKHFTNNEVFSVLLCYIMLRASPEHCNEANASETSSEVDPFDVDEEDLTVKAYDSFIAIALLSKYFEITDEELTKIFDRKILHPLVEFQYCLQHLNYLNSLLGEYNPTVYSKTYNSIFVYKILYKIKKDHNNEYIDFLKSDLECAPGVTAYLLHLMDAFTNMKEHMSADCHYHQRQHNLYSFHRKLKSKFPKFI